MSSCLTDYLLHAIDFNVQACGKLFPSTKRRIQWKFGINGENHELTLFWSIRSGKRLVLVDGQFVHYSVSRYASVDISCTAIGNNAVRVVAYQKAPAPGSRQYDLFFNGTSFFNFPNMYNLNGDATTSQDQNEVPAMAPSDSQPQPQPQQEYNVPVKNSTYVVFVPPTISPGDNFFVDGTDGTRMLVKCPPFAEPGMPIKVHQRLASSPLDPSP